MWLLKHERGRLRERQGETEGAVCYLLWMAFAADVSSTRPCDKTTGKIYLPVTAGFNKKIKLPVYMFLTSSKVVYILCVCVVFFFFFFLSVQF